MDTLTHALSGALAGRLLAGRRTLRTDAVTPWQAMAAGAIAAAFPDIDFLLGYVSELTYLRGHRGVTHSLLLWPLWSLLLAGLMAFAARRTGRRWREFYAIAAAGILIHVAGDLITQFGTMILAPFSDRRFGFGMTFIIDLVFSGLLLAGLAASLLLRRSRVPAAVALVAIAGWVGVSAMGRSEALAVGLDYAARQGIAAPVLVEAAPRPASPFNWTVIVVDGERYHYAHINTRRTEPLVASESDHFIRRFSAPYQPVNLAQWEVRRRFGDNGSEALARAVWQAEDFAFYRWFAMFPVLDHAEPAAAGGGCAGFRDLRFETPGRPSQPFRYGLCADDGEAGWRLYEMAPYGRRWIMAR